MEKSTQNLGIDGAKSLAELAKTNAAKNRAGLITDLFKCPKDKLVHDFLVEMDAKNKAYYFIMENGHFNAFRDYCVNQGKDVNLV